MITKENLDIITSRLFSAFFKGKLHHGGCEECALGNIFQSPQWVKTIDLIDQKLTDRETLYPGFIEEFDSCVELVTSLMPLEVAMEIEKAFEQRKAKGYSNLYLSTLDSPSDPDGFIGLTHVIDKLGDYVEFEEEEINLLELAK